MRPYRIKFLEQPIREMGKHTAQYQQHQFQIPLMKFGDAK